jgi:PHP family Zn ribbon phosphoesterase
VGEEYDRILAQGVPELELLLDTPASDLERLVPPQVAEGILRVRQGRVTLTPGYDGVYGKVLIFTGKERSQTVIRKRKMFPASGQTGFW